MMVAEKLEMQRRIDTLDQYASRLHAALTGAEREIARLTAELETVKRERDAAIRDMDVVPVCAICIHNEEKKALSEQHDIPSQCINCVLDRHQFVWRGLCAENGGDDKWMEK